MSSDRISRSSFLSACVLSALGTLPIHFMPILIAAAILSGRVSYAQAGLVAGMYSAGQIISVILLPLLSIRRVLWNGAIAICVLLVVSLYLTTRSDATAFYIYWLSVGVCAGVLNYLGVTSAAATVDKESAFASRSGISLVIAGIAMCFCFLLGSSFTYTSIITMLVLIVGILTIFSSVFYRRPSLMPSRSRVLDDLTQKNINGYKGLFVLFLFIVGQIGFIVFAVDAAAQRGIDIVDATWAITICKVVGGVFILRSASDSRLAVGSLAGKVTVPMLVLAAGVTLVANSSSFWVFLLGFLCWEIAGNLLSASIQANVVMVSPRVGSMFLSLVVLSGAALGPLVYSSAAEFGLDQYFFYFVLLSIFLPAVWYVQIGQRAVSAG